MTVTYAYKIRVVCTIITTEGVAKWSYMYLYVDGLASPRGAYKQTRLLVFHQQVHEERVADRIYRRHYDGVELGVLSNRLHVLKGVAPWHPLTQALLDKLVVVDPPLLREGHGKVPSGLCTALIYVVARPTCTCTIYKDIVSFPLYR